MSEKVYVCPKYPNLTIIVHPNGIKDANGNMKPSKRILFGYNPKYGNGVFVTSDPEMIEKIENSEFFKNKTIFIGQGQNLSKPEKEVRVGSIDSGKREEKKEEGNAKIKSAKTPEI